MFAYLLNCDWTVNSCSNGEQLSFNSVQLSGVHLGGAGDGYINDISVRRPPDIAAHGLSPIVKLRHYPRFKLTQGFRRAWPTTCAHAQVVLGLLLLLRCRVVCRRGGVEDTGEGRRGAGKSRPPLEIASLQSASHVHRASPPLFFINTHFVPPWINF